MESITVFEMELFTVPDLMDTVQLCSGDDEASEFLEAYTEKCGEQVATHNMRYLFQLIGYKDVNEADRLCDLFMVERVTPSERIEPLPIFGQISPRPVTTPIYDGCKCCRESIHKPQARRIETGYNFEQSHGSRRVRKAPVAAETLPQRTPKVQKKMSRKMIDSDVLND